MKPIELKGQNVVFGENQPEYQQLPAIKFDGENGQVITCWEFSDQEIENIVKNRCMYISQYTFNNPLQPILPEVNLEDYFIIKE